ncbi:MAG: membrane protein insertion efficiency factor YidD [Actinomycetota bacterium]
MRSIHRLLWLAGAPARGVLVGTLLLYRATVGRVAAGRCRFHPTCSAYALEAVRTHGAVKGSALAAWRVLRCSPLTAGGLDPVPPPGTWRRRGDPAVVR